MDGQEVQINLMDTFDKVTTDNWYYHVSEKNIFENKTDKFLFEHSKRFCSIEFISKTIADISSIIAEFSAE